MFPWLPFLTPVATRRRRPNVRRKRSSVGSLWAEYGDVRIEFLPILSSHSYAPSSSSELGFGSTTTGGERPDSAPIGDVVPPVPQPPKLTECRSSPRSHSANNSRPQSSAGIQAPPPAPTINASPIVRRGRARAFETSSAMMEIFGGNSRSQSNERNQPPPPPDPAPSNGITAALGTDVAATSVFQRIAEPSPNERTHFGRTNILMREGVHQTEWEPIPQSTISTTSSFQTIPNHDVAYETARHRGNWESSEAPFRTIGTPPRDPFRDKSPQNPITNECPVEEEIRRRRGQSREGRREGVAELLGSASSESPFARRNCGAAADAAGLPTTSGRGAPYGGGGSGGGGAPFSSAQEAENRESSSRRPLDAVSPPRIFEERQQLPNGFADRLRFNLSFAEDGSGMVAASGGGGGGGNDSPLLIIRGAQLVNDDSVFPSDVLIENGIITRISPQLEAVEGAEEIKANGRFLLPAGIDLGTELSAEGDEFNVATKAALSGGTTTILNTIFAKNDGETLNSAVERHKTMVAKGSPTNVVLSVRIDRWSDSVRTEVESLCAKGITSFVLNLSSDGELFAAMETLKKLGIVGRLSPENAEIISLLERQSSPSNSDSYVKCRPAALEGERIHRLCVLSQLTNSPIGIRSVGSTEAIRSVQEGRRSGALVSAEVPITALAPLNVQNSVGQSRIPIRLGAENDSFELLANGPLSVCVSDHLPIRSNANRLNIGTVTIGERLPVLWEKAVSTGRFDLMRFVAVSSTNAAKLLNLYPRKGRIAVGADADLVIWNTETSRPIDSQKITSLKSHFDGFSVKGAAELTLIGGKIAFKNGNFVDSKAGLLLSPQPMAPHVFGVVQLRDLTIDSQKSDLVIRKESSQSNGSSSSEVPKRSTTKVIHPPGGRSTGFW